MLGRPSRRRGRRPAARSLRRPRARQFWRIFAVAEAAVVVENALAIAVVWRLLSPADPWLRGEDRSARAALKPWRARRDAAGLRALGARGAVRAQRRADLGVPDRRARRPVLAVVLHPGPEPVLRPVLEEVSRDLPDGPGSRACRCR
jgi:adenylate cyclase